MLEAVNPGCIIHAQIRGGWGVSRDALASFQGGRDVKRGLPGSQRPTSASSRATSLRRSIVYLLAKEKCFSAPMITSAANRQSIFKC